MHCASGCQAIQIALQENRRRHRVHLLLSLIAADVALDEQAVGLGRSKPLIPGLDGHAQGAFERGDEILDFRGCRTVTAIHVPGQADQDRLHFLVADQLLKPRQEISERFGEDELQRLGNHLQLIADGDADAFASVVNGEDTHEDSLPQKAAQVMEKTVVASSALCSCSATGSSSLWQPQSPFARYPPRHGPWKGTLPRIATARSRFLPPAIHGSIA